MCGIAGALTLSTAPIPDLRGRLAVMNELQAHRGPDGQGTWRRTDDRVGFAHRRLSIIDLVTGHQPMTDGTGNWITYNGEIYNYKELRAEMGGRVFRTASDTEVILRGYERWGDAVVEHLRGMFAFALWDEAAGRLFCARDRFGIKPLYYMVADGTFYFASETKALLPFVDRIETDLDGLKDYLAFQLCLAGKTLFKGIRELLPGHRLVVTDRGPRIERYWEVYYDVDFDHSDRHFEQALQHRLSDSVAIHLRADVPVGVYLSGGTDSSIVSGLARHHATEPLLAFTGKFSFSDEYDESRYARAVAAYNFELQEIDIQPSDFVKEIRRVIYHLDYPVAGPGSFAQYMVSQLAARARKVVVGGQGGDEVFGGYARYLIAYFEQCIKAAIDGSTHAGDFIVTYESIIPNLATLKQYKPLLQHFWRDGLFEARDRRYFRLINRASALGDEINWDLLGDYSPFETFQSIFHGANVGDESYFDQMTHFDFKTLLPALLQVEDRVSMAHGLESRVPMLDHPLVELAATIPSNIKFKDGRMKHVLKNATRHLLPPIVADRQDKMGFPTPVIEWSRGPARDFVRGVFSSSRAQSRDLIDNRQVLAGLDGEPKFGRRFWALLSLELWQQEFHDREPWFKGRLDAVALDKEQTALP